jgi:succinate dehydrogenase / fumarate reductase cytochrome b subunit
MHGWFHWDWWLHDVAKPFGGAQFRPYNAASSAGLALQSPIVLLFYLVGALACVFHFANGLWTMGITWGVWISPPAQARALKACMTFGVLLALVTAGALFGMRQAGRPPELEQALEVEDKMYESRIETGEIEPNEHKRSAVEESESATETAAEETESAPKE